MAKETKAQIAEREARHAASRVPATIADVWHLSITVRGELTDIADDRERLIYIMKSLGESVIREAGRLEADATHSPDSSLLSSSYVTDIPRMAEAIRTRERSLLRLVNTLQHEGVTIPGVTVSPESGFNAKVVMVTE